MMRRRAKVYLLCDKCGHTEPQVGQVSYFVNCREDGKAEMPCPRCELPAYREHMDEMMKSFRAMKASEVKP